MVSKGQFVGLDWNHITRLHSQALTGTQEVKNSLTASRCHLKAYPRCGQPTSKVTVIFLTFTSEDVCCYIRNVKSFKSTFFATCVVLSCLLAQFMFFFLSNFLRKKIQMNVSKNRTWNVVSAVGVV